MSKDPDLEDAPVAPEMGTIELKAYRCQILQGTTERWKKSSKWCEDSGRISELSKKVGWHHVVYVPSVKLYFSLDSPWSLPRLLRLMFLALETKYLPTVSIRLN